MLVWVSSPKLPPTVRHTVRRLCLIRIPATSIAGILTRLTFQEKFIAFQSAHLIHLLGMRVDMVVISDNSRPFGPSGSCTGQWYHSYLMGRRIVCKDFSRTLRFSYRPLSIDESNSPLSCICDERTPLAPGAVLYRLRIFMDGALVVYIRTFPTLLYM